MRSPNWRGSPSSFALKRETEAVFSSRIAGTNQERTGTESATLGIPGCSGNSDFITNEDAGSAAARAERRARTAALPSAIVCTLKKDIHTTGEAGAANAASQGLSNTHISPQALNIALVPIQLSH
jgi:hypothetical protein